VEVTVKYQVEMMIARPRALVTETFADPDGLSAWQPTLKRTETIEGTPGATGSRRRMVYEMKGRETELVETVTNNGLPDRYESTYDAGSVFNIHKNRFISEGDATRWIVDTDFRFTGFMRLVGVFFRGSFPKQTRSEMANFKHYVEALPSRE